MTLDDVLDELLQLLSTHPSCFLTPQEVNRWPHGALNLFLDSCWLQPMPPVSETICPGCEEHCLVPVHYGTLQVLGEAKPFIVCDQRSDMGRVSIDSQQLHRWELGRATVATWVNASLKLKGKPEQLGSDQVYSLGNFLGANGWIPINLDFEKKVSVEISGHEIDLIELTTLSEGMIDFDRQTIETMANWPSKATSGKYSRPPSTKETSSSPEIGSPEWRKVNASRAANAKHNKPGGSREKQAKIRDIWASGKYSTRDLCAEEECAALGMSFSVARKALRNTPDPKNT